MVPVDQTQFRSDGHHGNCFQASVASILELPLDSVPNFAEVHGSYFMKGFRAWVAERGLGTVYLNGCATWPGGAHSIATGKSPRGNFLHSVVWFGRRIAHDPHPSRDGIVGDPHEFIILAAKP